MASTAIDTENDMTAGAGSSSTSGSSEGSKAEVPGGHNEESSSLGAIFRTAYATSDPSSSSTLGGPSSISAAASAASGGPRLSNASDLFAPDLEAYFEDSTSQLFADSDHDEDDDDDDDDDVLDHDGRVQALFVDTSSPRSPMTASGSVGVAPGASNFAFATSAGSRSTAASDPYAAFYPSMMSSTPSM
jgi:hypothetical protein